jgi:hypothetical protein
MMGAPLLLVTLAAFAVVASCSVLTLHRDYQSGIVGTFFLALIAFGAFAQLVAIFEHDRAVTPVALFVWVGLAGWFGRTLWKFAARLRERGKPGWYKGAP